ncbi:LLM class flavin-dependent oxidoreductase [Dactylosporangium sp. CA-092794]|uniref:LLM class flavin-dependent oxidoreductase n=1 Tax=Dactylosporangium sp. CA-092794 TaxID=3239929 RepID=UPI003D8AABAD
MRFGLYFVHQLPRPWADGAELNLFHEGLAQVELADRLGIDYAWVPEQHFLEEYSHSSAPEVFLAAASQRTSRIRLGHGVILMPPGYNAPARVAERVATMDLVSNGRVEFGVGDSKSRMEIEGFGITPDDRRAMSLEALEQVADMLTMEPYPGFEGQYFSMPARNVVPKPAQRPHPPLWMACSDDASIRLAARLGVGALAHGFHDPDEAARVVEDYYETFKRECVPIGHAVNPNVAMLNPFYCHADGHIAAQRGTEAAGFFTFAVRHYYSFGRHRPGRSDLWERYLAVRERFGGELPLRGSHAIGTPEEIAAHLRAFEEAGVDQTIFAHQAGRMDHEQVCESLRLFGRDVLPGFAARAVEQRRRKQQELEPYVAAALRRKALMRAERGHRAIPACDAYGLGRADADLAALPEAIREQVAELQRMKRIALRLDSEIEDGITGETRPT